MYLTYIYSFLTLYYSFIPIAIGRFLPEARSALFLCVSCGDALDSNAFIALTIIIQITSILVLYISEKKIKPIVVPRKIGASTTFLVQIYLSLGSIIVIVLAPLDFGAYISGTESSISKIIYTSSQILIAPSLYLVVSGQAKSKRWVLVLACMAFTLLLFRLKRLELFISVICILFALLANNKIGKIQISIGGILLAAIGTIVGIARSVLRNDVEIDYFGMLWEPSFVFRSFLATYELNYSDAGRLISDLLKGLALAVPEFLRSIFGIDSHPFNLESWGGDENIRPLGGHHLWAQFYQAIGWAGMLLPVLIISVILRILNLVKTKNTKPIIGVGVLLIGLSLGSAFRDHFYSIFRFIFYWFIIWYLPFLIITPAKNLKPDVSQY